MKGSKRIKVVEKCNHPEGEEFVFLLKGKGEGYGINFTSTTSTHNGCAKELNSTHNCAICPNPICQLPTKPMAKMPRQITSQASTAYMQSLLVELFSLILSCLTYSH